MAGRGVGWAWTAAGRSQRGSRKATACWGTPARPQPRRQGIRASRSRWRPLSAPGSGQVGARSRDTPSWLGLAETPWGPSSNTANPPSAATDAIQLIAATSQRARSRAVTGWAGRSSTPPEVSAAQRSAGWARGTSRRSNSWRWRQSTLSTNSNQGVLASKRPSSRSRLAPQQPRHRKLVQSGPRSSQVGSPCQAHSSGCSR